ncbi:MAG: endonuclease III [Nitrososphaerota archaeon]|nr:endonuclease III [Candidatus Bathyarchaeota archaeon]MDW8049219.1 endonuclease III [Nitrososphaerota archaeon]
MENADVRERVLKIIDRLEKEHPDAKIALRYSNPLELLVATMLSAQCTDERVNEVTRSLFKKYRTAEDYAKADLAALEEDIRPTGFYKNKARNLKKACQILVEKFNSEVPRTMEDLLTLPGVARKTANIVLSNAYGIIEGIAVDTHVRRLAERLGLTVNKDQDKIEKDLMEIVPREKWARFTDLLIFHGRRVCSARKPQCDKCVLIDLCPSASTSNP